MPLDEESKLSGKLLPHTRYGYMNKAYEGFGEYPVPKMQTMADPKLMTSETDNFYDTKMWGVCRKCKYKHCPHKNVDY